MDREIEIKLLDADLDKFLKKIKLLGAKKVFDVIYNRLIFDFDDNSLDKENAFVRLRTDGNKTWLTYKKRLSHSIDGTQEHEVEVNDMKLAKEIMLSIGLKIKKQVETRRIRYDLNNIEVDVDFWPKIKNPVIELESKTKIDLENMIKLLKLKNYYPNRSPRFVYKKYGLDYDRYKILKLEKHKKDLLLKF